MVKVKPRIFFLGQPSIHWGSEFDPGVQQWLHHIGGEEAYSCLSNMNGSDIEQLIELMARRCYKSYSPGLNPNVKKVRRNSAAYHANILDKEHGSVIANGGMVTYAFEDVSRVFSHEIVRNWVGTERSQESLRYVRLTNLRFWIPPSIASNTEKRKVLPAPWHRGPVTDSNGEKYYSLLSPLDIFEQTIAVCEWAQKALAEYFDIDNIPDFETKKKLTSAFRRVAPIGLATGIGMSFNLRALRWICHQRTSEAAEEEIRLVFGMVARDAMRRWPMIFQDVEEVDTGDGLYWYKAAHPKV